MTTISIALRSLRRWPMRSALTGLGVIIGIASVVTTASIGSGAKRAIEETLSTPESRTLYLGVIAPTPADQWSQPRASPRERLTADDYYSIRHGITEISAASPRIYIRDARVQASGKEIQVTMEGIDVDGFATVPRRLLEGALFGEADVNRAANVCVISATLREELQTHSRLPIHSIRIDDISFLVLGIVDDAPGTTPTIQTKDRHVYVPFTSALKRLDRSAQMVISIQVDRVEHIGQVQQKLSDLMEQRRSGRKQPFFTTSAVSSIETYTASALAVSKMLAALGAVSLIVGGVGIMNIMLVTVRERTHEIGVRMAIGTRSREILFQFLLEAIVLSLLGGGIGIGIGCAASWLVTRMNGWPTLITPLSLTAALALSFAVGVFFGYQPAKRASALAPVQALQLQA